jgi:hypothetical protein
VWIKNECGLDGRRGSRSSVRGGDEGEGDGEENGGGGERTTVVAKRVFHLLSLNTREPSAICQA